MSVPSIPRATMRCNKVAAVSYQLPKLHSSFARFLKNKQCLQSAFYSSGSRYDLPSNQSSNVDNRRPFFASSSSFPHDKRVFFFDIDNCLYPKTSGIPHLMKARIEQYFRDSGIPHTEVERLAHRYYVDYGLAIRGLVEKHPEIDIKDYDSKVDGGLPLEKLIAPNPELRDMMDSMKVGKKWLFTNAGENHARRVIRILDLEGIFHGMTYCNYLEPHFVCKPDQKSFAKAMREAGVQDPSLCYLADDSTPNIDMAVKIGWTGIDVIEKFRELKVDPLIGEGKRYRVETLLDLPNVLPQFWDQEEALETGISV